MMYDDILVCRYKKRPWFLKYQNKTVEDRLAGVVQKKCYILEKGASLSTPKRVAASQMRS